MKIRFVRRTSSELAFSLAAGIGVLGAGYFLVVGQGFDAFSRTQTQL